MALSEQTGHWELWHFGATKHGSSRGCVVSAHPGLPGAVLCQLAVTRRSNLWFLSFKNSLLNMHSLSFSIHF